MTQKQFIKNFVLKEFHCSDYFFESAWKHIEASYRKSTNLNLWRGSLYVLYDKTRTDKEYDAVKTMSILYEAIKEIEKTGKAGQFLKALEEASKRHRTEEELRLKILKNLESVTLEVRDIIKTGSIEKPLGLEKSTLEIDYLNEEPIIKINGKLIEEFKTNELFFARFVRLAVARKVNELGWGGRIPKYDEPDKNDGFNLYVGGFCQKDPKVREEQIRSRKRDDEVYELREFLEKECEIYRLNKEQKKKLIPAVKRAKRVRLAIRPEDITTINIKNLKKFKSTKLHDYQPDKYGVFPSEIAERLIKDACFGYENPSHKISPTKITNQKL